MSSAHVHAIDRLADFKAALQTFTDKAKDAMSSNQMEINRAADWLETQLQMWKSEVRRAEDEVFVAKNELSRRKMMRIGPNRVDTTEQEKDLRKAQAKLTYAEEKRDNTKQWIRQLPDAVEEYNGQAKPFQDVLEFDMVKMINVLAQKIAALEEYQRTNPGGGVP